MDVKEAAAQLGIHPSTVRRWIRSGKISAKAYREGGAIRYEIAPQTLQTLRTLQTVEMRKHVVGGVSPLTAGGPDAVGHASAADSGCNTAAPTAPPAHPAATPDQVGAKRASQVDASLRSVDPATRADNAALRTLDAEVERAVLQAIDRSLVRAVLEAFERFAAEERQRRAEWMRECIELKARLAQVERRLDTIADALRPWLATAEVAAAIDAAKARVAAVPPRVARRQASVQMDAAVGDTRCDCPPFDAAGSIAAETSEAAVPEAQRSDKQQGVPPSPRRRRGWRWWRG